MHQNDIVEAPHNKPDFGYADTPHNVVATVSGPPSGIDPSGMMILPQHQLYQVSCPPLPRPAKKLVQNVTYVGRD